MSAEVLQLHLSFENSIYNAIQKLREFISSHEINDQMRNKCLENGFNPMVINLIALSLKIPTVYGIGHHNVIAKIAIYVFMHFVNIQLLVVHMFHMVR